MDDNGHDYHHQQQQQQHHRGEDYGDRGRHGGEDDVDAVHRRMRRNSGKENGAHHRASGRRSSKQSRFKYMKWET